MADQAPDWAIIALGANLGNPAVALEQAVGRLSLLSSRPILRSSFWNTSPVDCPPGSPVFVNAAVAIVPQSGTTPESLLDQLQSLEREFGRQAKIVMNEPRPLDLDLIAWGQRTCSTPRLVLPHPRAHLRKFVLQPVGEILPQFILPGQVETILTLLHALVSDESVRPLDEGNAGISAPPTRL